VLQREMTVKGRVVGERVEQCSGTKVCAGFGKICQQRLTQRRCDKKTSRSREDAASVLLRRKNNIEYHIEIEDHLPSIIDALQGHWPPALADLMLSVVHYLQILTSLIPK
jgi:hypothetical protein